MKRATLASAIVALLCACAPADNGTGRQAAPASDGEAAAVVDPAGAVRESRMLLSENFGWLTPEGADEMLDRTQRAGFNVLIPCVWAGMGVTWRSDLDVADHRAKKLLAAGADPLRTLITKAHARRIEVHPWFKVSSRFRDFHTDWYDPGTPKTAFDVHKPAFRDHIVALMLEVVERYEVDGINLDYIRTKGMCTSAFCAEDYRNRTGGDLARDSRSPQLHSPAWQRLVQWNTRAIDDIVERFSIGARQLRPGLLISADSLPGREKWKLQGADSVSWLQKGWVDVVYNMEYDLVWRETEMAAAKRALDDPSRIVVLVGNFDPKQGLRGLDSARRRPEVVSELIERARARQPNANGVALYKYEFLTDAQIETLAGGPFAVPAVPYWPARDDKGVRPR